MTDPIAAAPGARSGPLDLLKAALVAAMVSAHVVQLLSDPAPEGWRLWSEAVNLVAFPGFLLAFGMGVGLSRPRARGWGERLVPVVKLLLAVWASSFGYALLVERLPFDGWLVREVMTTEVLWGWSEFLTSFLVLSLLLAAARPVAVFLGTRPVWGLAAAVAGLATTMASVGLWWPLVGGLLPHRGYPNFPLLAYLPWFLAGVWLGARGRGIGAAEVALGAAATGTFLLALWTGGEVPSRFPPSVPWILGAGLPLALLLRAAQRWGAGAPGWLTASGRHVLASLVLSNLLIFGARFVSGFPLAGGWAILGASLALIAAVTLWGATLSRLAARRRRPAP